MMCIFWHSRICTCTFNTKENWPFLMPKQDNHFDRMQEQSARIRVIEMLRVCWVMLVFYFLIRQLDIIWHRYSFSSSFHSWCWKVMKSNDEEKNKSTFIKQIYLWGLSRVDFRQLTSCKFWVFSSKNCARREDTVKNSHKLSS